MRDLRTQVYLGLRTRGLSMAEAIRQLAGAGMADFSIAKITDLSIELVKRVLAEKVAP